jgi:hypothetical protein
LDLGVDGVAEAGLEVLRGAEAADEEDGFDGDFGGGDLVADELDDFEEDGLEDCLEVRGLGGGC